MNRIYGAAGYGCQNNILAILGPSDPFSRQRQLELETRLRHGRSGDPEGPPAPKPGDQYLLLGAIAGLVVGGTLGFVIGNYYFGFINGCIGILIGIIFGGVIGTQIVRSMRQRRQKTNTGAPGPL
jgi:predicted lipid-binding transport protein (Tim44 family)